MSSAKTVNERQKEFRARMREQGLKELRNLWALPEDFEQIRTYVGKLNRKKSRVN